MRSRVRSPFAYAGAVVVLTTAGCAMLTGASDLTVAVDGDGGAARGGSTSEGGGPSLASPDGGEPNRSGDASDLEAEPPDAGPDPLPAVVRCNDTDCTGKCCVAGDSGQCVAADGLCPIKGIELSCDERADCPMGLVCCLSLAGGSAHARCSASCPVGPNVTLCREKADCPALLSCAPLVELGVGPTNGFGACQ